MDEKTIDAVRSEILRLIGEQKNILTEHLNTPDLLKSETDDNQRRTLSRDMAENWLHILDEEACKVSHLEMTLAVVGAMKSGKSTTINAIVGYEVMPNRNEPMTAIPTLIRHKAGNKMPDLKFPKPQPFNQAVSQLTSILNRAFEKDCINQLCSTKDMELLVDEIRSGNYNDFVEIVSGQEIIFNYLKNINDIARLCNDENLIRFCSSENIPVPVPLDQYTDISDFPVIEVEYYHLSNDNRDVLSNGIKGIFTIIDTPGPNEAGQGIRLFQVLQDQLSRASAVLVILDYTQMKSQADSDVRMLLNGIVPYCRDHLYVLVNKFDQKDSRGIGESEVKEHVAQNLLKGNDFDSSRIYPVSSKHAFLANRALCEIAVNGKLPDINSIENAWVEDFASLALGVRWKKKIDDTEEIRDAANDLWIDSKFDKPLEEIDSL